MSPKEAICVFKGKLYDVYQWPQVMFDGSTATFEMLRRPYNGCVIATVGNKIMILNQVQPGKSPFLSLPGGRSDGGEDTLQTAQRELLEETGYMSEDWQLWRQVTPEEKVDWQVHTYIARNCVLKQQPTLDSGERIQIKLLTFEEFLLVSDDDNFRNKDAIMELLRIRLDQAKKDQFQRELFGDK